MSRPSIPRPGAGFLLLLLVLLGAGAFFTWGVRAPRLERVWWLQMELEHGQRGPLSEAEYTLLEQALEAHPELAADWLEGSRVRLLGSDALGRVEKGHAYLVKAAGEAPLEVRITPAARLKGAQARIRVGSRSATLELRPGEVQRHRVAGDAARARLVEVLLVGGEGMRVEGEELP
jgi:hypothetical protein